ncbi:MAG TPA: tail fiber domain-containing protein [Vicinamibacterales bacterium]|jgi:hypothetical protein
MLTKRLISIAVVVAVSAATSGAVAVPFIVNHAADIVGEGAVADPLIAVETNRAAIINRLVGEYRSVLFAAGVSESAFRAALATLRADQLLAASLVDSIEDVTLIVNQIPQNGESLRRYVPLSPALVTTMSALPIAEAYVVRDGDALSIVKAANLQLNAETQLVGYFAPTTTRLNASSTITPKDSAGSGANSWIGYTAGNNVASGTGSAVAAGTFNLASGQNAFVAAGQNNVASGVSALVIGGFDNQATAIDSMIGGGAGNRALGPRSVVVGGGYNLASGRWSFIGGGGRDGTDASAAGTNTVDNFANGDFSAITGGQGNHTPGNWSFVGGGSHNTASGDSSVVAGGGTSGVPFSGNTASGTAAAVGGGSTNNASGHAAAISGGSLNTASGGYAFTAGLGNLASGTGSVALGRSAYTQTGGAAALVHDGTFVFSDGSNFIFRSTAEDTFNVLATGGVRFVSAATNSAGEAVPTKGMILGPDGMLRMSMGIISNYGPSIAIDEGNFRIIGNQNSTMYFRTSNYFAWFDHGVHSDAALDPGAGGNVLATLTTGATTTTVTGTFRAQAFTATSDRNEKTGFTKLSPKTILSKVAKLPIMTWSYRNEAEKGIRHIGPVSQDFMHLFNVGYDDKSIATVDESGVALAAIQGLKQELDAKNAKILSLERRLEALERMLQYR